MEAHTITMDEDEARARFEAAIGEKHADSRQYAENLAIAYKWLSEGRRLISLSKSMKLAGRFDSYLPKLAIARADRREVHFSQRRNSTTGIFSCVQSSRWRNRSTTLVREINMHERYDDWLSGFALVPAVPPEVRPARGALADWFVLFEVDAWYKEPRHMTAPTDPFLLRHIDGDLYGVLAEWDLTEVERLILENR